uniref:Retrovirus-related Pol polyprotein from transposon TNT 1-94 n=1 Tax=Tanacetum cinerariifolium TaxID=118510 RepID=A0A699HVM7_TANCI|nr:hypothetical protein [Tanacetum cinerariifolium]
MSGTVPPIPPLLGTSSGSTGGPNPNRVDTMPMYNTPNTAPTINIGQNVVEKNLTQLFDSRRGSHVINVPNFDKDDFTSWKVRFVVFLDGLEPYLLKTLEDGPFVPIDTKTAALKLKFNAFKSLEGEKVMGTFTRLNCLLNDLENNGVMIPQAEVNATFVNSMPRKWLSISQTQRANNSIKNDILATLYGKYNDKKDQRTSNEFMADLNVEHHERALLENQKRFYKRSGRVGSARKPIENPKKHVSFVGNLVIFKNIVLQTKPLHHLIYPQTIPTNPNLTYLPSTKHLPRILPIKDYKGKYNRLKAEMAILTKRIDDLTKGKSEKGKNEKGKSRKEVIFTKADESSSMLIPEITSDSKSECETQEPLSLLPKPIGPTLAGTSNSLMSMANLTLNMVDLTLNTYVPKKTKPTSVNVSPAYVIKKMTENKSLSASGISRLNSQSNSLKSTKKKTWREIYGIISHEIAECPKNHLNSRKPRIANKRSTEPTEKQVTHKDIAQSSVMESLSPRLLMLMDQLGKFDEKVDDGFFLGYSLVLKHSGTERDKINFNENRSFRNDKFLEPRTITTQCPRNIEYFPYISTHENITPTDSLIPQDSVFPKEPPEFTDADDHLALNEIDQPESADNLKLDEIQDNLPMNQSVMFNPYQSFHPQLKVSFNLLFLKINGQEKSTSNWLTSLVNLWLVLQPKAGPENQKLHQRMNAYMNKVWSLVPKPHGKTIVRTKWIWKYKMDENGAVIKNKTRLVVDVFKKS